jgi:hypothetical protein
MHSLELVLNYNNLNPSLAMPFFPSRDRKGADPHQTATLAMQPL